MDNSLPRLPFGGRRLTHHGFFGPVASRRRCLWHPRRALARRRTLAPRTARFRRSVKSVGRCRPQVPSLNRVRRFLRPLSRPISAAPATPLRKRPPLQRRPPELLRPFDEVVSPTSPEPRLRPLNFFKEPELGRGLLVQLAAIEFSIREHDPRFVRIPSSRWSIRFSAAEPSPSSSGAVRAFRAARQDRHRGRSRDLDDNPSLSRRAVRRAPRVAHRLQRED